MTARLCPICSKAPPAPAYAPFCSRRCSDIDLQKWFTGGYAVPARDEEEGPGEAGRPETDLL